MSVYEHANRHTQRVRTYEDILADTRSVSLQHVKIRQDRTACYIKTQLLRSTKIHVRYRNCHIFLIDIEQC